MILRQSTEERGVFIVVLAIAIVTIFGVVALGIDGGRMFLAGMSQQRAADAGALAAGRQIGRIPDDDVRQLAADVAQDNFDLNNYNVGNVNFLVPALQIVPPNTQPTQVTITTSGIMPTLIAGRVVPGRDNVNVRAAASARRNFPAVILVIDNTGSMSAAARDADGNVIVENGVTQTKLDVTKAAARNFVRSFSDRDRIGIASYSLRSDVERSVSLDYDENELINAINNIPQVPWATNIQIGLLRALRDMENWLNSDYPTLHNQWQSRFIVLMTDGTPNQNARDDNQDRDLTEGWFELSPDGPDPDSDPDVTAKPHPPSPTGSCRGSTPEIENFVEAMRSANFVRSFGHTIITVAIGDPNNTISDANPFGTLSPWGNGAIAGNFMRWLANDYQGSLDQPVPDPDYPTACVPSLDDNINTLNYGPGLSLMADNAGAIDALFQRAAAYISLRLTS